MLKVHLKRDPTVPSEYNHTTWGEYIDELSKTSCGLRHVKGRASLALTSNKKRVTCKNCKAGIHVG